MNITELVGVRRSTFPTPPVSQEVGRGRCACARIVASWRLVRPRLQSARVRSSTLRTVEGTIGGPPGPSDRVGVDLAGDLGEAPAPCVLLAYPGEGVGPHRPRPAAAPARSKLLARHAGVLGDVALEFVDRDQPHTPVVEERAQHRDDAAVDRRQAHAERLGCLPARVRQPHDPLGLSRHDGARRGSQRGAAWSSTGRARRSFSSHRRCGRFAIAGHHTTMVTLIAPVVHLCLVCYRGQ
jgi:hypothetical protein